jgi:hypothetical protein
MLFAVLQGRVGVREQDETGGMIGKILAFERFLFDVALQMVYERGSNEDRDSSLSTCLKVDDRESRFLVV